MSPTLLGLLEAQKIYPGRRYVVISIASGNLEEPRRVTSKGATAGGFPTMLAPTISSTISSTIEGAIWADRYDDETYPWYHL
ncbi:hypothetical protein [Candidatus Paracaedibacter symbiosus]|uniref:hypothetical protein n=1 Tax=Candidatus Paracaedibacter symbiosus TaxID=244582 RepID=UPI0018DCF1EB|nr:hypothetical protein [Candidatus Paracaedibacter symbiosus]